MIPFVASPTGMLCKQEIRMKEILSDIAYIYVTTACLIKLMGSSGTHAICTCVYKTSHMVSH